MMKTLLTFFFSLLVAMSIQAQPINDLCGGAIPLTVGASCTYVDYSTLDATDSGEMPSPSCGIYQGADIWFTVVVPASGNMVIDANNSSNPFPILTAYTGMCGSLTELVCAQNAPSGLDTRMFISDVSLANQILYIRLHGFNSTNAGSYDVCAYEVTPPTNDHCMNATALGLVSGTTCTYATYTNLHSTTETGLGDDPSCNLYQGADVWFTFEVPASGNMVIDTRSPNGGFAVASIYTGTCGTLVEYTCMDTGPSGVDSRILINDASLAGQTLYFREHTYNTIFGGSFDVCLYEVDIPANDDCIDAIDLGVVSGNTCTFATYTNLHSTTETGLGDDPSCILYRGADVWFTFEVPASGNMVIDTRSPNGGFAVASIYTGTCGTLVEYTCNDNGPSGVDTRILINDASLGGQTIYLREHTYNTIYGGSFDLCLYEVNIPANDDCVDAIDLGLVSGTTCTYATYTNEHATTESGLGDDASCGFYYGTDVWFTFEVPASGNMIIDTRSPIGGFAVASIYTGTCGTLVEYTCNDNGPNGVDTRILITDASLAGQTMYLREHTYNTIYGGSFDLCLYEVDIPVNDDCMDAIDLGLVSGTTCTYATYTNENASTETGLGDTPSCGFYKSDGADVWYKLTMPASGHLVVDATANTSPAPVVSIFTGSCGTLVEYACSQGGPGVVDSRLIVHDDALGGQELYVNVHPYNSSFGNTSFDLCAYSPTIPNGDFCGTAMNLGTPNANTNNFVLYDATYVTGNSSNPSPDCGFNQPGHGDIWFVLTLPQSGKVDIETSSLNYPVISVYEASDCSNLTLYECNSLSSGSMVSYNNLARAGQSLYIRVLRYNTTFNQPFEMRVFDPEPLPVELTSFTVRQENESAILDWTTASEEGNSHFEIQHSTDGISFDVIGVLDGNGTSTEIQNYSFIHERPTFGDNYYRLLQVDFVGTYEFSDTKHLYFEGKNSLLIYPSPSKGKFTLELMPGMLDVQDSYSISIHNSLGAVVLEEEITETITVLEIPDRFPPGVYWVSVEGKLKQFGKMLIIQKD